MSLQLWWTPAGRSSVFLPLPTLDLLPALNVAVSEPLHLSFLLLECLPLAAWSLQVREMVTPWEASISTMGNKREGCHPFSFPAQDFVNLLIICLSFSSVSCVGLAFSSAQS